MEKKIKLISDITEKLNEIHEKENFGSVTWEINNYQLTTNLYEDKFLKEIEPILKGFRYEIKELLSCSTVKSLCIFHTPIQKTVVYDQYSSFHHLIFNASKINFVIPTEIEKPTHGKHKLKEYQEKVSKCIESYNTISSDITVTERSHSFRGFPKIYTVAFLKFKNVELKDFIST